MVSKKIRFMFLWFCLFPILGADEYQALFSHSIEKEASLQVFQKITAKLAEHKMVRAEFKQSKTIVGLKKPLLSEGLFLIDVSKGLYFDTRKPFEQLTVITPDYLIQKDSAGNVSRLKTESHPLLKQSTQSFLSIFAGQSERLMQDYELYAEEEKDQWQIGLVPKKKSESKEYLGRIVFKGDAHLRFLILQDKSGGITTIEFFNHRANQESLSQEEIKNFEFKN